MEARDWWRRRRRGSMTWRRPELLDREGVGFERTAGSRVEEAKHLGFARVWDLEGIGNFGGEISGGEFAPRARRLGVRVEVGPSR